MDPWSPHGPDPVDVAVVAYLLLAAALVVAVGAVAHLGG